MARAPLLSWDIFMDWYHKRISLKEDIEQLRTIAKESHWKQEFNMDQRLLGEGKVIIITDPLLRISFASSNMPYMNGYLPKEVIGKTPKIFQGKDTSAETKAIIRKAIGELQPFHVSLLNYRKNQTAYECDIESFPVFNKQGKHVQFIAFEKIAVDDF